MPDKIGPFSMICLHGGLPRAQQTWEIAARAGVSGTALWATGVRGEPFTLISQANALDYASGWGLLVSYHSLVNRGPVDVLYGDQKTGNRYKVLSVMPEGQGVKAVVRAHVAGDPTLYEAIVFARWMLIPLDPFAVAA